MAIVEMPDQKDIRKKTQGRKKSSQKKYAQLDQAWKEILKKYFKDFVELCWPEIFHKIDWSRGYEFLEQESFPIEGNNEIGKRISDKIIKIYLKGGGEMWAILLIETQAKKMVDFEERIYIYQYRAFDYHKKNIAILAILIDSNKSWRPNVYKRDFLGTELTLKYSILKILDFLPRQQELRDSKNPFAAVILAQLEALKNQNNQEARLINKVELTKWLYLHGSKKEDIANLLKFLECVMVLKGDYWLQYTKQVKAFEKEIKVSYMTYSEERWLNEGIKKGVQQGIQQGVQQGVQQGLQQGEAHLLLNLLKLKFNEIPSEYHARISQADPSLLEHWASKLLFSNSMEEIFKS